jgi:DegV family protein with EDD domain
MAEAVKGVTDTSVARMASRLAEAGVLGARGNSGMMLSHYFLGFADGLDGRNRAGPQDLAVAMGRASESIYQSVDRPVEGTILTVIRESTEEIHRFAHHAPDLGALAQRLLGAARASLERTPRLLPALREANVVDAGAKGFVRFVEGVVGLVEGRSRPTAPSAAMMETPDAAALAHFPDDTDRAFRYCSEFVVRGNPLPAREVLVQAVRGLGGSLIVTRASRVAKIHVHTDEPDSVEQALAALCSDVQCVKAEDMRAQHSRRRRKRARQVAIVTDSTCDLPPDLVLEHEITVVPLTVMFGDEAFLDQVDITHQEFVQRLVDPLQPQPTTSQPSPAQLEQSFRRAAELADDVLAILISDALSGTLGQAQAAAARFSGATVRVFDSRAASLGLGLQAIRAGELATQGCGLDEIVAELERTRERSGLYLTVDDLGYLQRSGRLGKARAFVGGLLDLKPILSVDSQGGIVPVDRVRGREALVRRVLELLKQRVPAERGRLRMGVAHVHCPDAAHQLAGILEREFAPETLLIRPAAATLSVHTGPGAWAVFYQAE